MMTEHHVHQLLTPQLQSSSWKPGPYDMVMTLKPLERLSLKPCSCKILIHVYECLCVCACRTVNPPSHCSFDNYFCRTELKPHVLRDGADVTNGKELDGIVRETVIPELGTRAPHCTCRQPSHGRRLHAQLKPLAAQRWN